MHIALGIASALLFVVFVASGLVKVTTPKPKIHSRMPFTEDYSGRQVKTIGVLEIVGAVGVIVPWLTRILPWLSIVAAFGLAAVMVGAIIVHARRHEPRQIPLNVVLLALALFVAIGRIAVH
jgi:uncharacterized membrane protein YphA (DoxX/SURF4 family)